MHQEDDELLSKMEEKENVLIDHTGDHGVESTSHRSQVEISDQSKTLTPTKPHSHRNNVRRSPSASDTIGDEQDSTDFLDLI